MHLCVLTYCKVLTKSTQWIECSEWKLQRLIKLTVVYDTSVKYMYVKKQTPEPHNLIVGSRKKNKRKKIGNLNLS